MSGQARQAARASTWAVAWLASIGLVLAGCASPTPTPTAEPTNTAFPTPPPTELPPTATATLSATATLTPTATTAPATVAPATAVPATRAATSGAAAPPKPTAAPAAAAYVVEWWADHPNLSIEQGCTSINWRVVGAREVYLQWPNQAENQVEPQGRQDYVCISEGETAVFTLRMVKQDGSNDIREMTITREEE